jgi:hypothetical protein
MWFERLLPEVSDHWLLYSVMLGCKVQVGGWHRAHADARNDRLESSLALDPDYGDTFTTLGEDEPLRDENQRYEKLHAKSLQGLLAKYNGIMEDARDKPRNPFVDDAERKLRFLEACDDAAEEANADGERLLLVTYAKRRGIGRRTASYPSMSSCPSSLRAELAGFTYHDVDIVSCHPSLEVGVCALIGKSAQIPRLIEYVNDRDAMLERIADHFKVDKSSCKYAVLRVLNGGSVQKWCTDMGIPPQ